MGEKYDIFLQRELLGVCVLCTLKHIINSLSRLSGAPISLRTFTNHPTAIEVCSYGISSWKNVPKIDLTAFSHAGSSLGGKSRRKPCICPRGGPLGPCCIASPLAYWQMRLEPAQLQLGLVGQPAVYSYWSAPPGWNNSKRCAPTGKKRRRWTQWEGEGIYCVCVYDRAFYAVSYRVA